MKTFIYHCPDAPEHHRYVGRMLVNGAGAKGGAGFLPVMSYGATREIAEQKLTDLWAKNGEAKLRKRGQLQPVDKGLAQTDTPEPRYFYHPESDCLMTTDDGSHPGTDELVEEIDRDEYDRIMGQQKADAVNDELNPDPSAHADDTDDELDGLLG